MAETTLNLGCAKINIKRDTHYYAPWHVINPRLLNPIPEGAKTYKLTPSTTLFFKKVRCAEYNFGWRQIKTKPKKLKEKNMYKTDVYFSERERAAVDRISYKAKGKKPLELLHENRAAIKNMALWQKAAVFLVEAHYDISRFFDDHRKYNYWNKWQYNEGTPKDKLTVFFLKQNKKNKENKGGRIRAKKNNKMCIKERRLLAREKSLGNKLASFFQKEERLPTIIENVIPNETIVPNAPPLVQPDRNPEYQEGTTINNYTFNVTCGIS